MATIEEMQVKLTLDLNALKAEVAQAKSQINSLGQHVQQQKAPVDVLAGSFKKLGGVIAAAFAAEKVVAFLKQSAEAATQDAKSHELLANQLRNSVGANQAMIDSAEKSIKALETMSAVADDNIRPAFALLTRATGDVGQATKLTTLALDVAAGTGKDLQTVSIALAKAHDGNIGALSKLGLSIKGVADPMAKLQEQFAGAAATAANNDPYQRMALAFDNIKESVGKALLPLLERFAGWVVTITPYIEDFFSALDDPSVVTVWGNFGRAVDNFGTAWDKVNSKVSGKNFFQQLGEGATNFMIGLEAITWTIGRLAHQLAMFWSGNLIGVWNDAQKRNADFEKHMNDYMSKVYGVGKYAPVKLEISGPGLNTNGSQADWLKLRNSIGSGVSGAGGAGSTTTAATAEKTLLASLAKIKQNVLDAQKKFNTDLAQLQKDYGIKIAAIQKEYSDKLVAVIQSSKDLLRNAFQQATQIDVGSMFAAQLSSSNTLGSAVMKQVKDGLVTVVSWWGSASSGGGVAGLLKSLEDKLAASKELSNNAAKLAGAGFSQNFIDQIVGQGTDLGNQMASAILASSPETQAALERVFKESETVTLHGVDALATQLYNQQGLATEALKTLYADTEAQFKDALTAANAQFNADSQKLYDDLKKSLDDANTAMEDALATAADAMGVTVKSLKKTYATEIGEISTLIKQVQKDADAALAKAQASAKALAEGAFTQTTNPLLPEPVVTLPTLEDQFQRGAYAAQHANANITPADSRNAPGSNLSINVTAQTNANAGDIANSIVNSIKLAAPMIISSTPGSIRVAGL